MLHVYIISPWNVYLMKLLVAKLASRDRKACRNAPCMFGHPHMFGCPTYVWMPPCLDTPHVHLDAPVCFDDVWMPLYIHNTKKACFVRLKGCPHAPIHLDSPICLDAPCMFGCALYVWMAPICLDTPTYVWMPPVCLDIPHMIGHPHVFGCPPVYLDACCTYTTQKKHALSD